MMTGLSLDLRVLAPLTLAAFAALPWLAAGLAPAKDAFCRLKTPQRLLPGEGLVAWIYPDQGVIAGFALVIAALLLGLATLALAWLPGATALTLALTGLAVFAWLWLEARNRWLLTDRRILTRSGAEIALTSIERINVAPGFIVLHGRGIQKLTLFGVLDAPRTARLIRHMIATRPP